MLNKIESVKEFNEVYDKGIVLADFYADWCGPCKIMKPILDEVSGLEAYKDKVKFIKVDVDQLASLAEEFNVMSIPTIFIMKDGKAVETLTGVRSKAVISKFLDNIIL
jgi:thioredoxin 1